MIIACLFVCLGVFFWAKQLANVGWYQNQLFRFFIFLFAGPGKEFKNKYIYIEHSEPDRKKLLSTFCFDDDYSYIYIFFLNKYCLSLNICGPREREICRIRFWLFPAIYNNNIAPINWHVWIITCWYVYVRIFLPHPIVFFFL
jgi:hypothetical protein